MISMNASSPYASLALSDSETSVCTFHTIHTMNGAFSRALPRTQEEARDPIPRTAVRCQSKLHRSSCKCNRINYIDPTPASPPGSSMHGLLSCADVALDSHQTPDDTFHTSTGQAYAGLIRVLAASVLLASHATRSLADLRFVDPESRQLA